ncbi:MAG: hypothetical protein K2Q10_08630, partial [Rhodospirillales bacterium]|nr:hypothetical protein [Rhodospirillales bacterium]
MSRPFSFSNMTIARQIYLSMGVIASLLAGVAAFDWWTVSTSHERMRALASLNEAVSAAGEMQYGLMIARGSMYKFNDTGAEEDHKAVTEGMEVLRNAARKSLENSDDAVVKRLIGDMMGKVEKSHQVSQQYGQAIQDTNKAIAVGFSAGSALDKSLDTLKAEVATLARDDLKEAVAALDTAMLRFRLVTTRHRIEPGESTYKAVLAAKSPPLAALGRLMEAVAGSPAVESGKAFA